MSASTGLVDGFRSAPPLCGMHHRRRPRSGGQAANRIGSPGRSRRARRGCSRRRWQASPAPHRWPSRSRRGQVDGTFECQGRRRVRGHRRSVETRRARRATSGGPLPGEGWFALAVSAEPQRDVAVSMPAVSSIIAAVWRRTCAKRVSRDPHRFSSAPMKNPITRRSLCASIDHPMPGSRPARRIPIRGTAFPAPPCGPLSSPSRSAGWILEPGTRFGCHV